MLESELLALARDRRRVTCELHEANDFYGHATLLKAYAGLPPNRPLKAAVEHGPPTIARRLWYLDVHSRLPSSFVRQLASSRGACRRTRKPSRSGPGWPERCASIVRPGGLLMLTCPNVLGFDIQMLGTASATVDAERLNYLHPASLGSLLEECGFEVVESQTPGRLDAELVRKKVLAGDLSLDGQPFLRRVLLDDWDGLGVRSRIPVENGLPSNMWVVGRRR